MAPHLIRILPMKETRADPELVPLLRHEQRPAEHVTVTAVPAPARRTPANPVSHEPTQNGSQSGARELEQNSFHDGGIMYHTWTQTGSSSCTQSGKQGLCLSSTDESNSWRRRSSTSSTTITTSSTTTSSTMTTSSTAQVLMCSCWIHTVLIGSF